MHNEKCKQFIYCSIYINKTTTFTNYFYKKKLQWKREKSS